MITIITGIISAISAILVAYIGAHAKQMEGKNEEREKRREKESLLSFFFTNFLIPKMQRL